MLQLLKDLHHDESGQGMAEYGLIIALVAVVVIVALTAIGTRIKAKFEEVEDALQ
ncbi:MAG TPA: Flp family type IVb pilin [Desulfotomaculum sp.]|nr:Flp family type IVb pilin [Desulfotomaculum sp.]